MVQITGILQPQKKLLRLLGFRFQTPEPIRWQIFAWLSWLSLALVAAAEVNYGVAYRSDVVLATSALCTILYCFNCLPKRVFMLLRRDWVYRYLDKLDDLWDNGKEDIFFI